MTIELTSVLHRNPFVTKRKYGENILLNYRNKYYELDVFSNYIWENSNGEKSLRTILNEMAEVFETDITDLIPIAVIGYLIFTENNLLKHTT
jgi:hypothetical protein